jgi:hypothetical protein
MSRSMSKNISLELRIRTERTLPDAVRVALDVHGSDHTEHRDNIALRVLNAIILGVEVPD